MNPSIIVVGEHDSGKTHYAGQLLLRLYSREYGAKMYGNATNIQPYEQVVQCLNDGRSADHTARASYLESVWPVELQDGKRFDIAWPDYGGEQIADIIDKRVVPQSWVDRLVSSRGWLLFLRLEKYSDDQDVFSRPIHAIRACESRAFACSDQARIVELLQILLYARGHLSSISLCTPSIVAVLSCWDEIPGLRADESPIELFQSRLPLVHSFIASNWSSDAFQILGLSSLETKLHPDTPNERFRDLGPEKFGYVVLPSGQRSPDLTIPLSILGRVTP